MQQYLYMEKAKGEQEHFIFLENKRRVTISIQRCALMIRGKNIVIWWRNSKTVFEIVQLVRQAECMCSSPLARDCAEN